MIYYEHARADKKTGFMETVWSTMHFIKGWKATGRKQTQR